ncbi:MAG: phosphoribosyltransferase family protein [Armatimonadota bacterium]
MNELSGQLDARSFARRIGLGVLDFVFPSRCHICGAWDLPAICSDCGDAFEAMPSDACGRCPRPADGASCGTCEAARARWGDWNFTEARAAYVFDGPVRRLIHEMKYRGQLHLADSLGERAAARVDQAFPEGFDVVVAMPGDPWRTLRRGANPVEEIARRVAGRLGCPVLTPGALRRDGSTAQMGRTSEERRSARLRFRLDMRTAGMLREARVLLVDDVFTTGASVHAAAGAIGSAGAGSVKVWTVAAGG